MIINCKPVNKTYSNKHIHLNAYCHAAITSSRNVVNNHVKKTRLYVSMEYVHTQIMRGNGSYTAWYIIPS